MAKIKRFEEIEAWKRARTLSANIYRISASGYFRRDFDLVTQVRRASISIMANIAEGFDSGSRPEFLKFLRYALRSATETQSHLYIALDQGYVSKSQFNALYGRVVEVKNLVCGFSRYLKSVPAGSLFHGVRIPDREVNEFSPFLRYAVIRFRGRLRLRSFQPPGRVLRPENLELRTLNFEQDALSDSAISTSFGRLSPLRTLNFEPFSPLSRRSGHRCFP